MATEFEGDPKLYLRENGSFLHFLSGQPDMDLGIWNATLISLNTREDWAGNILFDNEVEKYGSDFELKTEQNLSIQTLNQIQNSAVRTLAWLKDVGLVDSTEVTVRNPKNHNLEIIIKHEKNGVNILSLVLLKNETGWIAQEFV
jgi:phage gp46-like protein